MNLKTKASIHYILNTVAILLGVAAFVLLWSLKAGKPNGWDIGFPFVTMLIGTTVLFFITTIVLAKDQKKPWRAILPTILSSFLITIITTLIISMYNIFFAKDAKYWNTFSTRPWLSILMIVLAIPYTIIIAFTNIYTTKFLLISVSGDVATEWEIKNILPLISNKADIYHTNNFSYLYSNGKLFILKFVSEDISSRMIIFEDSDRLNKSQIVIDIENEIESFKGLDITIKTGLVYLSNELPSTSGNANGFILFKNKELFKIFGKTTSNSKITKDEIKMRIA